MGISTLRSFQGSQIFEAIGISNTIIEKHFYGTSSRIGGIDYEIIAKEAKMRHLKAFPSDDENKMLPPLEHREFRFRKTGEGHLWNPKTIFELQHDVRKNNYETYKEYAKYINEQEKALFTIRGMFSLKNVKSIPLDEGIG